MSAVGLSLVKLGELGDGTYGKVYEARLTEEGLKSSKTQETVAVKQNTIHKNSYKMIGSVREIYFLNLVKTHPYCIQLRNVTFNNPFLNQVDNWDNKIDEDHVIEKTNIILEKGTYDGNTYIRTTVSHVNDRKLFAVQVMLGLEYLHSRGIYHRDLKPANIICFSNRKVLKSAKLSDFGLSEYYDHQSTGCHEIVTLWYRAPEILLRKHYDYKIDVWSIGCILFELFSINNIRMFQPDDELGLINMIITRLKFSINDYNMSINIYGEKINKNYTHYQHNLKSFESLMGYNSQKIEEFNNASNSRFDDMVDLISKILVTNPKDRYNISESLNHKFFNSYTKLINKTRNQFHINNHGVWVTKPDYLFMTIYSDIRSSGMKWFKLLYNQRNQIPFKTWYTHKILFHAIDMFDRFLCLCDFSAISNIEIEIVIWINTFLFIAVKFFRVLLPDCGPDCFNIGIKPTDVNLFIDKSSKFEEFIIKDVFKYNIYSDTLYEISDVFLNDNNIQVLLSMLFNNTLPIGMSLKNIFIELVCPLTKN